MTTFKLAFCASSILINHIVSCFLLNISLLLQVIKSCDEKIIIKGNVQDIAIAIIMIVNLNYNSTATESPFWL